MHSGKLTLLIKAPTLGTLAMYIFRSDRRLDGLTRG
jgi:hypothetical protein